jgi:hypothetical protein
MANLMNDDRVPELLSEMLIKQDRHEGLLVRMVSLIEGQGKAIQQTNLLVQTLTEAVLIQGQKLDRHTELLSSISERLSDNGTHEVRITDLERSVFGEKRPAEKKPSGPKPKPKAKGK